MGLNNLFENMWGIHDDYIEDADKHRFIFIPLDYDNKDLAINGEIISKRSDGSIYIKDNDGNIQSKDADLQAQIDAMYAAGIVEAAVAFQNNKDIFTIYKKNNKVMLDEMLKISKNFRYWALRGVNPGTGEWIFLTGNVAPGGIENSLVDIEHDYSDPTLHYTGTALIGTLYDPLLVLDGHIYYVDFYDTNRVLRSSIPVQCIYVNTLDFALAPEENIIGLSIASSQDRVDEDTGNNICFLYQGQNINVINFYIRAHYADGSYRNINSELAISRLVLTIPEINPLDPPGTYYEIEAKYYTEELNTGEGGEFNDLNYASITTTKQLKIYPDTYVGVKEILPVPFTRSSLIGGVPVRDMILKSFALYVDGKIEDVSLNSRLTIGPEFDNDLFGVAMSFQIQLGLGYGTDSHIEDIVLHMESPASGKWIKLNNETMPSGDGYLCNLAYFDDITDMGTVYMQLRDNNGAILDRNALLEMGRISDGGSGWINPTHFRVRSVLDTSIMHTPVPVSLDPAFVNRFIIQDNNNITKTLSGYSAYNDNIPYPVLIEFIEEVAPGDFKKISMHPFSTVRSIINP